MYNTSGKYAICLVIKIIKKKKKTDKSILCFETKGTRFETKIK